MWTTMWTRALLLTTLATLATRATADDVAEEARLDVPGLVRRHGYPLEQHAVRTEDGYVLTAHRIPHAPGARPSASRTPVLVMHGMACSSADFLVLGPGRALGYLLADAGYDVWLANARGNFYSRRHLTLDPDDRDDLDFWRFSWDEIGNLDLPALVEHVTEVTGRRRMHYVGYSQGTTAFLVLAALRPTYNARFISFQALAPAAYSEYSLNTTRDAMVQHEALIDALAFRYGFVEMTPRNDAITEAALVLCRDGASTQALCAQLLLGGGDTEHFNKTLLPVILGHNPAGSGIRQLVHYSQVQRFNRFARFNFDPVTNLARYGRLQPPEYDVTRLRVPTFLYYGMGDLNSLHQNVQVLARRLGDVATLQQVPRRSFNHFDFIWSNDARAQVYDPLIVRMRSLDLLP